MSAGGGGRRWAISIAASGAAIALAGLLAGPIGFVVAAVVALLVVVWRHDTPLGTCFPITVLMLIAFAIILVLFYMLMAMHLR